MAAKRDRIKPGTKRSVVGMNLIPSQVLNRHLSEKIRQSDAIKKRMEIPFEKATEIGRISPLQGGASARGSGPGWVDI